MGVLAEEKALYISMTQGRQHHMTQLRVVGGDQQELPWDGKSAGELQARGPLVCQAYYEVSLCSVSWIFCTCFWGGTVTLCVVHLQALTACYSMPSKCHSATNLSGIKNRSIDQRYGGFKVAGLRAMNQLNFMPVDGWMVTFMMHSGAAA